MLAGTTTRLIEHVSCTYHLTDVHRLVHQVSCVIDDTTCELYLPSDRCS